MSKKEIFYNFIDEKSKKYFLWVTWSDGDAFYLRLVLSDCMNYWSGKYTKSEIEKCGNVSNFDLDGIKSQFSQAFQQETRKNFLVKFTPSEDFSKASFVLKKILEGEIKVEIISLSLKIEDDPTPKTEETFEFCHKKINNLENRITELENEVKRLMCERNEALKTLKECVEMKEDLEYDMYSKFVEILNAKKRKIKELTEMDE